MRIFCGKLVTTSPPSRWAEICLEEQNMMCSVLSKGSSVARRMLLASTRMSGLIAYCLWRAWKPCCYSSFVWARCRRQVRVLNSLKFCVIALFAVACCASGSRIAGLDVCGQRDSPHGKTRHAAGSQARISIPTRGVRCWDTTVNVNVGNCSWQQRQQTTCCSCRLCAL